MSKQEIEEAKALAATKDFAKRCGVSAELFSPYLLSREEIMRMDQAGRENWEKLREYRIDQAKAREKAINRIIL